MSNPSAVSVSELMLDQLEKINENLEALSSAKGDRSRLGGRVGMSGITRKLAGGAAVGGLLSYAKSVVDVSANMSYWAQILDMSATKLFAMEKAGQRFGTSFVSQLMNIKSIFAGLYQEDVSALYNNLAKFGFKNTQEIISKVQAGDTLGILNELQKEWANLSSNQKVRAREFLNFDFGMMNIMNNPDEFQDYLSKINVTQEDIDQARETKKALNKFISTFEDTLRNFVNGMTGSLDPLTKALGEADFSELGKVLKLLGQVLGTALSLPASIMDKFSDPETFKKEWNAAGERIKSKEQDEIEAELWKNLNDRKGARNAQQEDEGFFSYLYRMHLQAQARKARGEMPIPDFGFNNQSELDEIEAELLQSLLSRSGRKDDLFNFNNSENVGEQAIKQMNETPASSSSETNQKQVLFSPQLTIHVNADVSPETASDWKEESEKFLKEQVEASVIRGIF